MNTQEINDDGPTAARLRYVLGRLVRTIRREAKTNLSVSQISALATLEDFGAMRISALATHEAIDPSVATRVVASLEREGLFERREDPDDKRASVIDLSEAGHNMLHAIWNDRTAGLSARLERLNDDERRAISAALPVLEKLTRDPNGVPEKF